MRQNVSFKLHSPYIWTTLIVDSNHCAACSAYAEVEKRIAAVKSHVESFFHEELQARSRINSAHDPINKLPVEIISHIFEDAVNSSWTPLRLGAVSRYWRNVAWSTPKLWNNLVFRLDHVKEISKDEDEEDKDEEDKDEEDKDEEDEELENGYKSESRESFELRANLLCKCIRFSRSLPLTIKIGTIKAGYSYLKERYFQELVDLLIRPDVISRLYDLKLEAPFPCLSRFNGVQAPSLRKLALQAAYEHDEIPDSVDLRDFTSKMLELEIRSLKLCPSQISCEELISFKVRYCPLPLVLEILRKAKNLQSCTIEWSSDDYVLLSNPQEIISLPHLKSLVLNQFGTDDLLRKFSFSALQSLKLYGGYEIDPQIIFSFIERSHCFLKTLHLVPGSPWSSSEFDQLFKVAPTITTLGCTFISYFLADIFHAIFPSNTSSSPRPSINHLECTWVLSSRVQIDANFWNFIPEIFKGPTYRKVNDGTQATKFIKIYISPPPYLEGTLDIVIPKHVLEVIQDLEDEGWKWEISDRFLDLIKESRSRLMRCQ